MKALTFYRTLRQREIYSYRCASDRAVRKYGRQRIFNKAAADDSDRNLIEYLRGMVNISENNESEYLRNKNFSTTIVLEFTNSSTKEEECVGVVFDVETASNDINRLFFWHRGGILPNAYRGEGRVLSTQEIREYLQRNFHRRIITVVPAMNGSAVSSMMSISAALIWRNFPGFSRGRFRSA